MSEPPPMHPGGKAPDPRFLKIFAEANSGGDEVLDLLCPSFSSLRENDDRYSDGEHLGQGALKDIYRTFDGRTRRWVAMARLRKDRGLRYFDAFIQEAWMVAGMNHPNIIKVHDVGSDEEGRPFFTMDLRGNTSLDDLIVGHPALPLAELLEIYHKVCDAVSYAHSKRVIHLDLKPSNIQCDRFGEVLVCDWGLGKMLDAPVDDESAGDEDADRILGTPGYMAPEQAAPGRDKDERTDIYSLGCILHAILCGEPPFTGTTEKILGDTIRSELASMRTSHPNREIPGGLEAVVIKAMARDPRDRYGSVGELKREIQKYQAGYATHAEDPGLLRELRLFLIRNRIPVGISALALAILVVVSLLFARHLDREKMATSEQRQRANVLLSEVSMLSSDYDQLSEESGLTKKQLATNLATSANSVRGAVFFEQPCEGVAQAERLARMALDIDPSSREAHWQLFMLNCMKLDHRAALADPTMEKLTTKTDVGRMAKEFPDFAFGREFRPSAEQLIRYFETANRMEIPPSGNFERTLSYHFDAIRFRTEHTPILVAFLEWVNRESGPLELSYRWSNRRLELKSAGNLVLKVRRSGSSKRCLLRFLPLRNLTLRCGGHFDLWDLSDLDIDTLDLSECATVDLSQRVHLPRLKQLIVRQGQFSGKSIRNLIHSDHVLEITEVGK